MSAIRYAAKRSSYLDLRPATGRLFPHAAAGFDRL